MANKLLLFLFLLLATALSALTVRTVAHSDWENPNTWSSQQVPNNPDTIFVDHYITFNQALTIQPPTVLVVDSGGTLCGDYQFDISCGAKLFNYGRIWVNSSHMMDAWNYFEFYAKNAMSISACNLPGYGAGYYNVPPNGHTAVWPPVLCRTPNTYWDGGPVSAVNELEKSGLAIFPNPLAGGMLHMETPATVTVQLQDLLGNRLEQYVVSGKSEICLDRYKAGMYLLRFEMNGKAYSAKIIKTD